MSEDRVDLELINGWQRDFPLVPRPFKVIGAQHGLDERALIARLRHMRDINVLSRIGAVVRPNTAGASTLAAMRVSPARLEHVAALVNAEAGVNHNYQRDHAVNLWFVATAANTSDLKASLRRISRVSGCDVMDLPLVKAHHIDLGFAIGSGHCLAKEPVGPVRIDVTAADRALLAAMEDGLPLVVDPYAVVAGRLERTSEGQVIDRLARLLSGGVISRLGLVVRHRELGFTANAMAVWDIDEENVDRIGARLAKKKFVTLCYQRRRAGEAWPFNLYCMVHGKERAVVQRQINALDRIAAPYRKAHDVLFSIRCFKQRGARFSGQKGENTAPAMRSAPASEVSHA